MAIRALEVFRAGTHTSSSGDVLSFEQRDLQEAADAYNRHRGPRANVVIGHPAVERADEVAGPVRALVESEGKLYAVADIGPKFVELVRAGRFKHVSASFYGRYAMGNPAQGTFYLRHVGMLGAMPPAIKGLEPLDFAAPSHGGRTGHFHCDGCAAEFAEAAHAGIVVGSGRREAYAACLTIPGLGDRDRAWVADYVHAGMASGA